MWTGIWLYVEYCMHVSYHYQYYFMSALSLLSSVDQLSWEELLLLLTMSSIISSFNFNYLTPHYRTEFLLIRHISVPVHSSLLHATSHSAISQIFSQFICAQSFICLLSCCTSLYTHASYSLLFTQREPLIIKIQHAVYLSGFPSLLDTHVYLMSRFFSSYLILLLLFFFHSFHTHLPTFIPPLYHSSIILPSVWLESCLIQTWSVAYSNLLCGNFKSFSML